MKHSRLLIALSLLTPFIGLNAADKPSLDCGLNKCRLSFRERAFFRGAKDDNVCPRTN